MTDISKLAQITITIIKLLLGFLSFYAEMDTEEDNTGTTGDSGFADARPFLKVSIEPSSSSAAPVPNEEDELTTAGYYKSIRREEVGVSYYKLANREAQTQMFQGQLTRKG